jgi:hypothetical protein
MVTMDPAGNEVERKTVTIYELDKRNDYRFLTIGKKQTGVIMEVHNDELPDGGMNPSRATIKITTSPDGKQFVSLCDPSETV